MHSSYLRSTFILLKKIQILIEDFSLYGELANPNATTGVLTRIFEVYHSFMLSVECLEFNCNLL